MIPRWRKEGQNRERSKANTQMNIFLFFYFSHLYRYLMLNPMGLSEQTKSLKTVHSGDERREHLSVTSCYLLVKDPPLGVNSLGSWVTQAWQLKQFPCMFPATKQRNPKARVERQRPKARYCQVKPVGAQSLARQWLG